ncbi:MAG: DUF4345 family protein [Kordiimonadaceae bacterium]|nr:DUF4345 family protein [Kordiimonadaceae bacterium]
MITILLTVFGVFFVYTGAYSMVAPERFARMLSLETLKRSGEIEIRAQYGGFFLAAGLSQFLALAGYMELATALIISLVIFGGLIAGRLIALMLPGTDARISSSIRALYAIDAIGTVGAGAALFSLNMA